MTKTASSAANAAVSNEQPASQDQALEVAGAGGAVAGTQPQFSVGLSDVMRDKLSLDLQKTLHAIEMGIGESSATKVAALDVSFDIIDGIYIDEFLDRAKGELISKTVFRLECSDGVMRMVMQNAARPRKLIADGCEQARALGARYRSGPYKFEKKGVGQINDAWIFAPQQGWRQEIY